MKKIFSIAFVVLCSSNLYATKVISINSLRIMQKSKEGNALANELQNSIKEFQEEVSVAQRKISDLQQTIQKQSKIMNNDARLEKAEELANMKRKAERDLADKEELIKKEVQRKQYLLREKQLKLAKNFFDENGGDIMIDENMPGVLFVNDKIDKTDEVLRLVDSEYEKELTEKNTKKEV